MEQLSFVPSGPVRPSPRRPIVVVVFALTLVGSAIALAQEGTQKAPSGGHTTARGAAAPTITDRVTVTPVSGLSTLHHLGREIEQSSMGWGGQMASTSAPPPALSRLEGNGELAQPFVMTGEDLYRVSCRSCHRVDGSGAPPEINSVIGPVRSASFEWEKQRMKELGRNVDDAFLRGLATESEADLRKRLKEGGHNMPSFGHLSDDEIAVLRRYLDQLAGVPGGHEPLRIAMPITRVGELVVKGTCHICHDAAAGTSRPTTVLSGIIPGLAAIPRQKTMFDFVQKVTVGAPVPLSAGGVSSRGRMPVFNYFSERETAAAYMYLLMYWPR